MVFRRFHEDKSVYKRDLRRGVGIRGFLEVTFMRYEGWAGGVPYGENSTLEGRMAGRNMACWRSWKKASVAQAQTPRRGVVHSACGSEKWQRAEHMCWVLILCLAVVENHLLAGLSRRVINESKLSFEWILSGFIQRRPWVFWKVPREHEAHETLGTKELSFSMWEALCFDSVIQDPKGQWGHKAVGCYLGDGLWS